MQKLEEILRAEEAARHTVAAAKERASAMIAEAEANAKTLAESTRSSVVAEGAAVREDALRRAHAEAEQLTAPAGDAEAIAARERIPEAIDAAIAALTE